MKALFIDEKMDNLHIGNSQKRAQVAQSWPKWEEKGYFKRESRKARRLRSIDHLLFREILNVEVETSEYLDPLN